MPNPTIVLASLDDKELQASINKMVANLDKGLQDMLDHTNTKVKEINEALKGIGNVNFGATGSNGGDVVKQTKAQNEFTDAVKKSTDEIKRQGKEAAMSFDNFSKAQQVAIRSANPSGIRNAEELQTMNIQLDLLRERLREARQQYSSFVALAAHATTTGDKGLFQYATDGVHRYEQEVRNLIPQIRTLQSGIQQMGDVIAPQGHTIQNYVNSLQKANPELAALNAQYKSGTSLLQDQSTSYSSATQSAQRYTEEIRKQAQAIRESQQWKETGTYSYQIGDATYYVSKKQGEIEAQLVRHKEQQVNYQKDYLTAGMAVEQSTKQQASAEEKLVQAEQQRLGIEQQITQEKEKQKKKYTSPTSNEWVYNQSLYNEFVKNRLGGKAQVSWKENTSDINTLNAALSQLRKVYSSLTSEERAHPYGQSTLDQIQRLERRLNVLRSEMSRPLSFNAAMGLPEKTLDDISYKMQRLRAYKQGIDLTKPNAANEIKQVDEALAKLQKDADKWMSKSQEMIKSNTALGRSWNYMKNRLAFYFTVGASTQFVKNLIEVRSQYEMNERALGILINSAERGKQIFQELSNMALVSPYTLIELSAAAKQLTAYDVAAKDVVDTTRRLADMAAAVGIPIERLTYALGQIKAYGYLNARDARMFSNAGIPLVKQLSEYYTELEGKLVSTADVYDRIKKKAIGYNDVMQVVNKMTDEGGKFFDFQAKMADTLKVRLANLTLAWNNMLNEIGQDSQGLLNWGVGALKNLFLQWKNFESALNSLAMAGGLIVGIRVLNVLLVKSGVQWGILSKQMTTAGIAGGAVAGKLATVGASLKALVTSPMTWWTLLAFAIVEVTRALMNMDEAQKKLNQSIRDGAKDNYENVSKFLERYKGLRESLYKTERVDLPEKYRSIDGKEYNKQKEVTTVVDIDKREATKAWEAVREQIELTTKNANDYIGSLVKISNMSERIRKGFAILEDIAAVNAALKDAGDDAVEISGDFMNLFGLTIGDGLITNLKDYADKLKSITDQYGSLENAQIAAQQGVDGIAGDLHNLDVYLGTLQVDLKKTTDSILNFIQLKGWSGDVNKISETFSIAFNKIALENNLTPQQATQLRVQAAQAEYDAIQNALQRHIADENVALSKARDDNEKSDIESRMRVYKDDLSFMQSNTAQSRVYWEDFTKWMSEQHKSEVQAMFKGQSAEQIRMLDFTKGEYNKWVVELAQKYAKEHGMSYKEVFDQLRNYILNANQWSIRIPVMLDIQNLSWLQEDFKNRLPESSLDVSQYKTLSSAISDWQKKRKEGLEEIQRLEKAGIYLTTGGTEADREHYAEVQKEVSDATAALKAYKAELTKGSGGKKKDPILDALKLEASLVEKLQGEYDKLTKSGASQESALNTVWESYGKTIRLLNVQLSKFGLPQLDITQLITGKDPHKALEHFQQTLNTLVSKGMLTLERSKELEAVMQKLTISAKTYDLDKVTKGLNSELGRLKDEYELAVSLDADPELGSAFAGMFGIDQSQLIHSIDEYMRLVQEAFDKSVIDMGYGNNINLDVFAATKDSWRIWAMNVGLSEEQLEEFSKKFQEAQGFAKKWTEDVIKQTRTLQYNLADTNGKIAIKEKELADLRTRYDNEQNEKQKELLRLRIQEQENAITELRAGLLQEIPEYAAVFNSIVERSDYMTRKLVANLKKIYDEAKARGTDAKGNYTIVGAGGQTTLIGKKQFEKEYDKLTTEERKSQAPFKKIKQAFSKDSTTGLVDWAKGLELVGGELGKLQGIVGTFGSIAEAIGADPSTVETINDVATSIGGISTAAQGISQIASGDYLAGAASLLSGAFTAISTWFDNDGKKIDEEIKDSELAVKKLENQYKKLEAAVEETYGTMKYGAEQAVIANKKMQLEEKKRQLQLEKSRSSKNRDDEKIESLKGEIIDLEQEIKKATKDIINDMLGITSVGDAAEQMVSSMIDAFRNGEDYMAEYSDSFEDMIDNMIMKSIVSHVIGKRLEEMWNSIEENAKKRGESSKEEIERQQKAASDYDKVIEYYENLLDIKDNNPLADVHMSREEIVAMIEKYKKEREKALANLSAAEQSYSDAIAPTPTDVEGIRNTVDGMKSGVEEEFKAWMDAFGISFGDRGDKNLSNLQQGIQGITEDTAGALEAITNGISQQCYLQSDLLTQIRDSIVGLDMDVQVATQAQMLLQLQQSYTVQMAIQAILEGVLVPNGRAFAVELVS